MFKRDTNEEVNWKKEYFHSHTAYCTSTNTNIQYIITYVIFYDTLELLQHTIKMIIYDENNNNNTYPLSYSYFQLTLI